MACPKVKIPGTDLLVSRICLGCWQFSGEKGNVNWEPQTVQVFQRILNMVLYYLNYSKCSHFPFKKWKMACPKIIIPGTALEVSRVCLGCWQLNDGKANASWGAQSKETSQAIVDKCFEVGINFFDTAEGYAGSEEILGECLKNRERSSYVVASKFGFREGPGTPPYSPVQIEEAITKSLNKLKIEDQTEAINQLNKEIQNKRIRYWGLSNYGPKNLQNLQEKLAKLGPNVSKPVCNQVLFYIILPSCYGTF
ncbi:hypothetical protein KUTeg_008732 [Tegillarca granosa]|uniref:NADP-dependent oxidoreductase domain-containing protein n=1 Tax=Tegillarca granosa TaxID=220873 RepID=A0ABQ9FD64_TEGGR|nr:hypothetical protein KUTeg_008732 [Tegillarca granosa]